MKILVTGGAGYIGSILVPALLDNGHDVAVVDNFMFRQTSLNQLCSLPGFTVHRADARAASVMQPLLAKADVLIPLAALVGAPMCDADQIGAQTTNVDAIEMATRMMSKEQFLLIPISNSGYGIGEPGKECTEETPMRPVSLYGRTKVRAEEIAMAHGNTISFRLATVFGMSPRMRLDLLVNDFVHRAVTDRSVVLFEAHFKRNYVHVRDVARAFVHGLTHLLSMRGRPYNVGLSDANLSKAELCQRIAMKVPGFEIVEAEIGEDPDKRDYVVSNARIEAAGFRTRYSLDHGIEELIKGFRMLRSGHGNA